MPVPHPKAVEYGNQLIGKFLNEKRLVIPAKSVLAEQLKEGRLDTPIEELFALSALRYLLAGITESPYEYELADYDLSRCLAWKFVNASL